MIHDAGLFPLIHETTQTHCPMIFTHALPIHNLCDMNYYHRFFVITPKPSILVPLPLGQCFKKGL